MEWLYQIDQLKLEKSEGHPFPCSKGCSSEWIQNAAPPTPHRLMRGDMGPLWGNPPGGTPPGTFIKRWNAVSWGIATIRLDADMFNLEKAWLAAAWLEEQREQWETQGSRLHVIRSKPHVNQTLLSYLCCVFAIFFIIYLRYWEKWGKKGIIWIK